MNKYEKLGYLSTPFKLFHLSDIGLKDIQFHYHDFHKILIHLKGNTSYCIEGRTYDLKPNDIVLVNAGEVHRPIINNSASEYERIIIYVSKDFLSNYSDNEYNLNDCFNMAKSKQSHVIRLSSFIGTPLEHAVKALDDSTKGNEYAKKLHHEICFLEFMIQLNRATLNEGAEYILNTPSNSKTIEIIDFLNQNITSDINIDTVANKFFLSRYYLMHSFKEETGYTIGGYITTKRLILAKSLINSGHSINDACFECGFKNYSTFLRAYKKAFGTSPTKQDNTISPQEHLSIVE